MHTRQFTSQHKTRMFMPYAPVIAGLNAKNGEIQGTHPLFTEVR